MTDEPKISDAEVAIFRRYLDMHPDYTVGEREVFKRALAAFLAARVPGANPMYYGKEYHKGFNACRDIVWKGRE